MKDYRDKEIKYLLFTYVILLLYWCTAIFTESGNETNNSWSSILSVIECVAISSTLSIAAFIGDSLFSSKQKDNLVGLFFIPRPGNTIFSRIANGEVIEDRFMNSDATTKYASIIQHLPSDVKKKYNYENSHWYKIYIIHQNNGSIIQAQKDYLLCRDLFIETVIFITLYLISLVLFSEIVFFSWRFLVVLLFMAIVTNITTHKKMNSFINNVIATDLAKENR